MIPFDDCTYFSNRLKPPTSCRYSQKIRQMPSQKACLMRPQIQSANHGWWKRYGIPRFPKKSQEKTHAWYIGMSKSLWHSSLGILPIPYKSTTNKRYVYIPIPSQSSPHRLFRHCLLLRNRHRRMWGLPSVQLDHQYILPTNISYGCFRK